MANRWNTNIFCVRCWVIASRCYRRCLSLSRSSRARMHRVGAKAGTIVLQRDGKAWSTSAALMYTYRLFSFIDSSERQILHVLYTQAKPSYRIHKHPHRYTDTHTPSSSLSSSTTTQKIGVFESSERWKRKKNDGKINPDLDIFGTRVMVEKPQAADIPTTTMSSNSSSIASNTTNCSQMLQSVTREWYVKTDAHITSSSNYSE